MMGNQLEGRVALITGSSRGIGSAIARLFAAEGATVAVHGRDKAAIEAIRLSIEAIGGRAVGVHAELTDFDQIERMRADIESAVGPVDLLVANAGGTLVAPGALEETPIDAWKGTVDANLTATFLTLKSFLPGMKQRGRGDIVTISSYAGRRPHSRSPIAYAVAKAGVQLLTQDVALQAGPFGIRANCIAPETILTEDNSTRIPNDVQARLAEAHALHRLGTPEDVARTALFLASPAESGWMTGIVIDLHGGTQIG
jgi:3-oxoacyl-[acyl-carrier protein] reductase